VPTPTDGPRRSKRTCVPGDTGSLARAAATLAHELEARAPQGERGDRVRRALNRLESLAPEQRLAELPEVFLDVAHELGANEPHPGEALEALRALVREQHAELLSVPAFAQVVESDQRRSGMLAWLLRENVDRLERVHHEMAARESELEATRRDRDQLEAERRALARELDHLRPLADAGLLAAGVAHDLKNLLQAVAGHADMARAALPPSAEAAPHLRKVILAADHAAELSRRIVRWSKAEPGCPEPLDLSQVAAEVVDLVAPGAPEHVQIRSALEERLPMVMADPTDVRRIILNLVVNAWQAIGDAEGEVRIATGAAEGRERGAWLEVGDDGRGMDGETRDRLFEPFYSTRGGHGLGLSTVRTLVERQGGSIEVWSEPGRGARLRVTLPAAGRAI
jgi:signal transduction histidine kinase